MNAHIDGAERDASFPDADLVVHMTDDDFDPETADQLRRALR